MTGKLLMIAAVVAIAFVPQIGRRPAEAHGGGFGGAGMHGGGFVGGGFHGGGLRGRGFLGGRRFRGHGFAFRGLFGGYYPGYYGNGACYLTVYGTTNCY
jgi:hypothetical protein